jgi:hypothetical protein
MRRRWIALGLIAGLGCFALGLGAARVLGGSAGTTAAPPVEPRIVLDPGSVRLLPDASLHLDLHGFDAGLP